jgi:hypothetical protein
MLAIEGWGNPNQVLNAMGKNGEDNRKVGKIGQVIN